MPSIPFGISDDRRTGNFPPFVIQNMFLEQTPTNERKIALLSRPGLSVSSTVGTGAISAIFSQDGTFSGDTFAISGGVLYRGPTALGSIPGSSPSSIAASTDELLACSRSTLRRYDGTTLADESFPDSAPVAKVVYISSFFVAARGDSQKYYWRLAGTDVWNALDFASAEARPDNLADVGVVNEILWLFGSQSVEPWQLTGNADLPFSKIPNATFDKGIFGTGCVAPFDNSLCFVGSDNSVYRIEGGPKRISTHAIEEKIAGSIGASCFSYSREGHSFLCVRYDGGGLLENGQPCPAGTAVYDAATGHWTEFSTAGHNNFRPACSAWSARNTLFGDGEDGTIWEFSGYLDGADQLERIFTAAFPIPGGRAIVDNLTVDMNTGWDRPLSGQGSAPVMELACSRDAGRRSRIGGPWRSARPAITACRRGSIGWARSALPVPCSGSGSVTRSG
jgi:hypothetical protein